MGIKGKGPAFVARTLAAALFVWLLALGMAGCTQAPAPEGSSSSSTEAAAVGEELLSSVRTVSLKGPTSVGLAVMMDEGQGDFTVVASGNEAGPLLLQDEVDIALVPANLAATLYQKTEGQIRVIDVNTLGVLSVITADESVSTVEDLAGRTVYMTGKGTVPEYTLAGLLAGSGLSMDQVDVQFRSEPAEVVAMISQDDSAIGILPQPYATSAVLKSENLQARIDLTEAWEEAYGDEGSSIITGVTIAKASYVEENPDAVAAFLTAHAESVDKVLAMPDEYAQVVVDRGIIDDLNLATKAIPNCNIVCLTGDEMKSALSGYLSVLYEQDPASVGGSLPGDDFYYIG